MPKVETCERCGRDDDRDRESVPHYRDDVRVLCVYYDPAADRVRTVEEPVVGWTFDPARPTAARPVVPNRGVLDHVVLRLVIEWADSRGVRRHRVLGQFAPTTLAALRTEVLEEGRANRPEPLPLFIPAGAA